jgi:hypothetical protein
MWHLKKDIDYAAEELEELAFAFLRRGRGTGRLVNGDSISRRNWKKKGKEGFFFQ